MGYSRWDSDDWKSYAKTTSTKSTAHIFTSTHMKDALNPLNTMRESRDSVANPNSNAIIVGLDVTGSMGMLADALARDGLGVMVEEILKRKPVTDPHTMIMAIGDAYCDRSPLQITQFESDNSLVPQLADLWLEKGGGGNRFESYNLPWYYAATHTSIDCFEKRNKKGYLFTIGDEEAPAPVLASQIKKIIGDDVQRDFSSKELLTMANRMYEVFHIIVEEGSHARAYPNEVYNSWVDLLGQRVIRLSDHKKLAEVIVSAIEVNEGKNVADVTSSWSGSTSVVVKHAMSGLVAKTTTTDVVRF
jgi:hypothetical protein